MRDGIAVEFDESRLADARKNLGAGGTGAYSALD